MDIHLPLMTLLCAGALATFLVPISRSVARRVGAIDRPGRRKHHAVPTPRLGGIAVAGSCLAVVGGGYWLVLGLLPDLPAGHPLQAAVALLREAHRVEGRLRALLAGAVVIFCVGLVDDLLGERFPVWLKAAGQLTAALVVVVGGGVTTSFLPYEWMNVTLSLLWIVGIANAFNLLDNMDGLSAGVALVASSILCLNAWSQGSYLVTLVFAAFVGSLAGFLAFNFRPASVFLGDCGSLFIGYLLASLTLLERYVTHASNTLFPVLMPAIVLAVPIVDTATVVAIRMWEGRPVYVGDRRHLSHQLVYLGFSEARAVLALYLATACLGLGAFALVDAGPLQSAAILLQTAAVAGLMLTLMFGTPAARSAFARSTEPPRNPPLAWSSRPSRSATRERVWPRRVLEPAGAKAYPR